MEKEIEGGKERRRHTCRDASPVLVRPSRRTLHAPDLESGAASGRRGREGGGGPEPALGPEPTATQPPSGWGCAVPSAADTHAHVPHRNGGTQVEEAAVVGTEMDKVRV